MASYRKVEERTPNNGAYSEIYFFDESGHIVDETVAVRLVIRECNERGELLKETWGITQRGQKML